MFINTDYVLTVLRDLMYFVPFYFPMAAQSIVFNYFLCDVKQICGITFVTNKLSKLYFLPDLCQNLLLSLIQ